jgi:UDP-glucose 4-epimerase
MRVVVTGASGFLGQHVTDVFRKKSIDICPVARTPGVGIFHVQSYDQSPLADVLVHLAEDANRARVNDSGNEYKEFTLSTLDTLLKKGYKKVLYASSAILYGDKSASPHQEDNELVVVDTYTSVKSLAEKAVLGHDCGIVIRLSNIYGPGMSSENVLSKILGQLDVSTPMQVWDDRPVRDMLWVDDAAVAIADIAIHSNKSGLYNLGSGVGTSVEAMARLAMRINGQQGRLLEANNSGVGSSELVLDIEKTKRIWGWQPHVTMHEGLRKLIENRIRK